mgnify:CR=1 FL=1
MPGCAQHNFDRGKDQANIGFERHSAVIFGVELRTIGKGRFIASRDLPRAGDAWAQGIVIAARIHFLLAHHHRARTDKAHIALQHVPKLRELVQRGLAQYPTDRCNARI